MGTGTITSMGLGSGLDITSILESLQEADEVTITAKEETITELQASQDEFNVLNAILLDMKSSASSLSLSSNFLSRSVSVSSEILRVSSSDGAETGTYSIEVDQLASKSSFTSSGKSATTSTVYVPTSQQSDDGFSDTDTTVVLEEDEEMSITYGTGDDREVITITGGAGGYTLDDLADAINNDAANDDGDGGTYVTASVIEDDEGNFHLQIASTAGGTGEDNRVMVTVPPESMDFSAPDTTFSYAVGETQVSLTVSADTSLEELAELINDDEDNPGVTASVVDTGYGDNPYQLVLTADSTGEDNRITITQGLADLTLTEQNGSGYVMTSESAIDFDTPLVIRPANNNTQIVFEEETADGDISQLTATIDTAVFSNGEDLAEAIEEALEDASADSGNGIDYQVSYNESTGKLEITEAGTLESLTIKWSDAGSTAAATLGFTEDQTITPAASSLNSQVTIDNVTYQRQGNEDLSGLISGISLDLTETGSANITVTEETESIKEDIIAIVSLFNDLLTEIDSNDDYDEDEETWGTLAKYSSVDTMKSNLLSLLQSRINTGGSITTFFDLGFEISEDGSVSLDEDTLTEALSSNFDDVKAFFIGNDDVEGLADQLNDHLLDLTKLGGYIESETGSIDDKIESLEDAIENETERIEKKYETLTLQYVEMDSYMREMESMQSYVAEIFSATSDDDD